MSLEKWVTKPTEVQAIQVTNLNASDIAKWYKHDFHIGDWFVLWEVHTIEHYSDYMFRKKFQKPEVKGE